LRFKQLAYYYCGHEDFDYKLVNYFVAEYKRKHKGISGNAWLRTVVRSLRGVFLQSDIQLLRLILSIKDQLLGYHYEGNA
jgi:hypothetical protein